MEATALPNASTARYRVTGMDCASCAAKIEGATRKVPGVNDVKVSVASQVMSLSFDAANAPLEEVERAIAELGYHLDRIDRTVAEPAADDDELPKDLSHITPAYRRALWTVVLLNVGYGLAEMVGGFVAGSQALKADALDFIGDGLQDRRLLVPHYQGWLGHRAGADHPDGGAGAGD